MKSYHVALAYMHENAGLTDLAFQPSPKTTATRLRSSDEEEVTQQKQVVSYSLNSQTTTQHLER